MYLSGCISTRFLMPCPLETWYLPPLNLFSLGLSLVLPAVTKAIIRIRELPGWALRPIRPWSWHPYCCSWLISLPFLFLIFFMNYDGKARTHSDQDPS